MSPSERLEQSFSRAAETYDEVAFMQHLMAERLAALVPVFSPGQQLQVLELGCGTGVFTQMLLRQLSQCKVNLTLNDLSVPMLKECQYKLGSLSDCTFKAGDFRRLEFSGPYNLIAANCVLQWIPDLCMQFKRLAATLERKGVLLFSDFGRRHFQQIRELGHLGLDYLSKDELLDALRQAGFTCTLHEELMDVAYPSVPDMLRVLKMSGVNGLSREIWTPRRLKAFCEEYARKYSCQDGVYLSWDMRYVSACLE